MIDLICFTLDSVLHPGHISGPGWVPINPAGNSISTSTAGSPQAVREALEWLAARGDVPGW